ncbi:MAG: DUF488 family protein [Ignavibacteria bacterium]|nr:DUF488 family protein [Ignavibacteria bacterium]
MTIRLKRVYAAPSPSDGRRILVDRLWPRGMTRENAGIHFWAKAIAPSDQLRMWYRHDPEKWDEFRSRYFAELKKNPDGVAELIREIGGRTTTFVFSSKEEVLNNAAALKEFVSR